MTTDTSRLLMPGKKTYLIDRTGAETDDKCGMKFWLNRKEGPSGIGVVPKVEALHLLIGRETHEDLATLAAMEDLRPTMIQQLIDDILSPITKEDWAEQRKMERVFRRVGWIAAWAAYMEPKIRQQWDTISIEKEIVLDRDPLWCAITTDRVLQHKKEGFLTYREYKTFKYAGKSWADHWQYDIQPHIGIAAVQEDMKRQVKFAQIQGLSKGTDSGERLYHPYVWGYYNGVTNSWSAKYQQSAAWDLRPVWEYPGGVVNWVLDVCGEEIGMSQFPMSAPIFLNTQMLQDWVIRKLARAQEIACVEDMARKDRRARIIYFEPRTQHCKPTFGEPCEYLKCCWNATTNADPASDPDFMVRDPHHDLEKIFNELD